MHITFVYIDFQSASYKGWNGSYYQGVASLSAILKSQKHTTSLIHIINKEYYKDQFLTKIREEKPDLLAFSFTTFGFEFAKSLLRWLHESKINVPVICGGIHTTLRPEDVIQQKGATMICIGEGEQPLDELCALLEKGEDITSIKNIWIKKDRKIIKNPLRPLMQDLDSLPFPDREIYDYKNLDVVKDGGSVFMASRGCPYKCSYCANERLQQIYNDKKYVRFLSVEKIILEIKMALKKFPFVKIIYFDDDILFLKKDWNREFSKRYRKEIRLPFKCNIHPLLINDEVLKLLVEAGCTELRIGVESGNEFIRTKILKRNFSNEKLLQSIQKAKSNGLLVKSYNMVGLPYETPERVIETIKINAKGGTDLTQTSIFFPFPQSELLDICLEEELIPKELKHFEDYFTGSALNLKGFSEAHIISFRNYFQMLTKIYSLIYKLPDVFSSKLEKWFDAICCSRFFPKFASLILSPIRHFYQKFIKAKK